MEDEAEKMAALKRAYADIILNTAKESAERVLAAERKALRFQQSLFAAKEEAVFAMVRLKALMEEKIREAEEKATVSHARKIEELELQLGEAEDTIVDLREDLKRVTEELLMIKNGSVQPLNEGRINDTCILSNNNGKETITDISNEPINMAVICNNMSTLSPKTTDSLQCCLQNAKKSEHSEGVSEIECPGNTDLASIIWTKVPELYRKGYTQRIHAAEHNFTSNGSFGESNGLQASSKSEPLSFSSEKLRILCKTNSLMLDKRTTGLDKDVSMFEETDQQPDYYETVETGQEPGCSGKDHFKFSGGFSPGMQRTIYNQSNGIFLSKSKSCCSSSSKFMVHDKWNENEALEENPDPSNQLASEVDDADISAERRSMMMNHCRLGTSIKAENMEVKQCTQVINCQSFQKGNQSVCEHKFLQNSLRIGEDLKDLEAFQEDIEDTIEGAVPSKEEMENITENSDNCNTGKSDSKDIANGTAQSGADKFLKYTFQRKRKKGSSPVKNEIVFPEKKSAMKPRPVDKQNLVPVPTKSSVTTDLPRNSRRLVQVARQLISLSEKRW